MRKFFPVEELARDSRFNQINMRQAQADPRSGLVGDATTKRPMTNRLTPDRADAILKRGLAYGESRVVCGVHFPSDIDAGRVVGATIVTALKANPQFQADFVVARAEFERARAAQTEAVPACSAALATPAY